MDTLFWNSASLLSQLTPLPSQRHSPTTPRVSNPHTLVGSKLRQPAIPGRGASQLPWRRHALAAEERQGMVTQSRRSCECHDHFDVLVPYVDAWRWQKSCVEAKVAMLGRGDGFDDTLIVLQHPPVYTLGTRSSEANLKFDVSDPPFELHRTERGGEVTYHGPGQLVMYPILNLRHHNMDLHWYLRTLEEIVIGALDTACGIQAHRIEGLTGVWVDNQKVVWISSNLLLRNVVNKFY